MTELLIDSARAASTDLVVRVMNTASTKGVGAPVPHGARREHTGSIRPTGNVAGRDASAAEGGRIYDTGHLVLPRMPRTHIYRRS